MKLISVFVALMTFTTAHAEWKFETLGNVQVHYYLPKKSSLGATKENKRALMINLHGCAQKAEDLKKDGNWDNTADDYNMIVALPKVPNGGVYSGCWDYYGSDHSESNRHNSPILALVKALLEKTELEIDPLQVYISGLSSGGGESMVLGCLAPHVFAGIGLNAGPSTGTNANEISRPKTSYQDMLATCRKLAGDKASHFKTQLTSIIYGNNDFIVNTAFNVHNAEIMRTVYEANQKSTFDTKKLEGAQTDGTGTLYSDEIGPRVSLIMNTNLGHNWPAGQGGNGGSFVNKKSINYPAYLAKFFFTNNRRAKNITLPEVVVDPIDSNESKLIVSGELTISTQFIKNLEVVITRKSDGEIVERLPAHLKNGRFAVLSKPFANGLYEIDIILKTHEGALRTFKRTTWLGEVGGVNPPQLVGAHLEVVKSCAQLQGFAIPNGEGKLTNAVVILDGELKYETEVTNSMWKLQICDLKEGTHTISVHVENEDGMKSNVEEFTFPSSPYSAFATIQEHMEAKRLKWEDYGHYYLKYSHARFSLYLNAEGVWSDKKEQ